MDRRQEVSASWRKVLVWFADGIRTGGILNRDREVVSRIIAHVGPVYLPYEARGQPPNNPPETSLEPPNNLGSSLTKGGGLEGGDCSETKASGPKAPRKQATRVGGSADAFEAFWKRYPRKAGKGSKLKAREVWFRLSHADQDLATGDLAARIVSHPEWHSPRDGGKFVPQVTTYLRGRLWEDDWGKEPEAGPEPEPEPDWECDGCGRTYPAAEARGTRTCIGCGGMLIPPDAGGAAL